MTKIHFVKKTNLFCTYYSFYSCYSWLKPQIVEAAQYCYNVMNGRKRSLHLTNLIVVKYRAYPFNQVGKFMLSQITDYQFNIWNF